MSKKSQYDIIAEMHGDIKEIKERMIPDIHKEIAVLKVKNGIWGALSGVLGGGIAVFLAKFGLGD